MTKGKIEFGIDNYIYGKEKIQTNANGTETIYARCSKKCTEGCKKGE